jgi:hypothetical protein
MSFFRPDHEIHSRRFGRNLGVGLALAAFVLLSFLLTVEKVTQGDPMKAIKGEGHAVAPEDAALNAQSDSQSATQSGGQN